MAKKTVAKKAAKKRNPAVKSAAPKTRVPAKKSTAKKSGYSKAAVVGKKASAKKPPRPSKTAAVKGLAVLMRTAAAGRRTRNPPRWIPGELVLQPGGVAFQIQGGSVTLQQVAAAGQLLGLVFPLTTHAGSPDLQAMLEQLLQFVRDHADGSIIGGVTTCTCTGS
jgi:hypothetical protein